MNALLYPLILFAIACCVTPGPNNIMLTASGANFGFKRTIPHILGITGGLATLMTLAAMGLGLLLSQFPQIETVLKVAGSAYILLLAWKIATISTLSQEKKKGKPFTFMQAALFQFLNPKALVMTVSAMATFTIAGEEYIPTATQVIIVFSVTCIPAVSLWAGFGTAIGRFLSSPRRFRVFNLSMGTITALSVGFIIL